jgi:hypothetical protein
MNTYIKLLLFSSYIVHAEKIYYQKISFGKMYATGRCLIVKLHYRKISFGGWEEFFSNAWIGEKAINSSY